MTKKSIGSKYDNSLDITEIAKRVRADIKAAVATGELPKGLKASARISRYSMGQSMYVRITAMPGPVFSPAFVKWWTENPHGMWSDGPDRFSPLAAGAIKTIESIVAAYNYDDSDSQVDHFDVNFYGDVNFDSALLNDDREATKLALSNGAAPTPEPEPPAVGLSSNVTPISHAHTLRAIKLRSGS